MAISKSFPPSLEIGSRVWTDEGYSDHGPMEGPKVNIASNMGGTITGLQMKYESQLASVKWDNGQESKHYLRGLFSIGSFKTFEKFQAAIEVLGNAELTIGPQGGFRHVTIEVSFDGESQSIKTEDRRIWNVLEQKTRNSGFEIRTTKLPPKSRKLGK